MNSDGRPDKFRISDTIREINSALVDVDSREAVETAVCETLTDSDLYTLAWVGERDRGTGEVVPRTAAGDTDGYLEEVTIAVQNGSTSRGPTATAVRTGDVQVVQDIPADPDYEPWRDWATERGFRSSAAIPLDHHSGTDVLNVYTTRPDGFDEDEREMFVELGNTIARAVDGVQARGELERQNERYETLTRRISDAFYAVDDDWRVTYWNEQMATRTGVSEAAVLGESLWTAFPELEGTRAETEYRTAMETGEATSFEVYLEEPFAYWVEVDVYPDDDGLSVFSRDITERKEREQRLEAIIENTTNAIYIKDSEGTYQLMNDAAARLFGAEPEAVVGKTDEQLFDAESAAEIREVDRTILETGEGDTRETVRYIDGREHVFLDNKFPYHDPAGNVVGVMGISHDITGRKARERDLRQFKRRLNLAIEAANVGTWDWDVTTDEVVFNEKWTKLMGVRTDGPAFQREAWSDRVHPDDRAAVSRALEAHFAGDTEVYDQELRIRTADDEWTWVRAIGKVVDRDAAGDPTRAAGIVLDIEDRKRTERKLRETRKRFESIISASPDAIMMLDEEYRVTLWNEAAERTFGWDAEEIVGRKAPFVPDEKDTEFESFIDDLDSGAPKRSVETVRETKDGELIDVSISSARVEVDGELVGYMADMEDVSQRKAHERRLEEQNERLEVLNRIVRHDIRNDMQVVLGFGEVLSSQLEDSQAAYADRIRTRANHVVELTRIARDLMQTILDDGGGREPTPLAPVLREQIDDVGSSHDEVLVETTTPVPNVRVEADEMLGSVFGNLLKNAVQHNDTDVAEIEVGVTESEETVTVRITDNGPGIPDERKESVFGKGKKGLESQGTGIGLYLVHSLVDSYGGEVWVEDRSERSGPDAQHRAGDGDPGGAVFVVDLPKAD